jgi:glycosyltransferase involved in cell wall biosynthesis
VTAKIEPSVDLSVSIVAFNSADSLPALFRSLAIQDGISWELFLVDNASTDRTAWIPSCFGAGNLTRNPENVGFGRAHNQKRDRFRGRYLLFLNPDLVVPRGFFSSLVKFLDENASIAIAGPTIVEGPDRVPFPPRRFYPGEAMLALEPGLERPELAWISGCCLAVRRTVFDSLGGFDRSGCSIMAINCSCSIRGLRGSPPAFCVSWQSGLGAAGIFLSTISEIASIPVPERRAASTACDQEPAHPAGGALISA